MNDTDRLFPEELARLFQPFIDRFRAQGMTDEKIAEFINRAARDLGIKLSVRVLSPPESQS